MPGGKKSAKALKFVLSLKNPKDPKFAGLPSDIVIPVMGPTGVGKSTFINSLLDPQQKKVAVGHGLESCTSHLIPIVIPFGNGQNQFKNPNNDNTGRLILLDTPGFDDTYTDDVEILRRIAVWLALSYAVDMKLAGVIYLHDITQTRMLGTTRRNLNMFQKLIGKDALKCVILGTTKWRLLVEPNVGAERVQQLESAFWKEMIDKGSQIVNVDDSAGDKSSRSTSCEIVNKILDRIKLARDKVDFLSIQKELVEMRKFVPQTDAGHTLKYTLDELIQLQKRRVENLTDDELQKGREELEKLSKLAKELKVPFMQRFMNLFS